ncbi:protocatechuate 3,4-dioxygenase [Aliikangiella coralliicola]|uniref:Protocatechuate 3,4-dioxygenase n=1 Tax=Aliikangiella coralliicola TaxID=2592383 RepID=A0A545UJV4_9GAMM|nr:protocatechuate 3,4-dioxygenase [Aliikangiella coralliicola]TQV89752.1 protocatechuate 3,4-dioxygenase [Aliikangiella coralliicola]
MKRRTLIKNSVLGTVATIIATNSHAQMSTPREVEGPFYPITPQKDQDADLTQVKGKTGRARGQIIEVTGQVFDQNMNPVEDVTIDLWQANSYGKYHHPHDNSEAPIDENFQAWAIIQSGVKGRFKFKTVIPGAYPLNSSQQRTPHIHFKISKLGYDSLLTQMYFPDHPLNKKDGLFKRKSKEEQVMMTAKKLGDNNQYRYDIIIEKV